MKNLEQGAGQLLVKDEGRLPTGSFKGRGLCMAVSMAKELGVSRIAMPTNGNAGAALAAYASRAGLHSHDLLSGRPLPRSMFVKIAAKGRGLASQRLDQRFRTDRWGRQDT